MYRFIFSDGYKLRLTWDYISQEASELGKYSGGTHWGQGGYVGSEKKWYDVLRPRDENNPFEINWESEREREMVDRIKSIPREAVDKVTDYQKISSIEKSKNLTNLYREIENIKVLWYEAVSDEWWENVWILKITYRDKKYQFKLKYNPPKNFVIDYGKDFKKDFKNKYFEFGSELKKYIFDKFLELKKKTSK
jgi:hypothetical protein